MVITVKVLLAGFGNIGKGFVEHYLEARGVIERKYGVKVVIVGVVDSRGAAIKPEGFSSEELSKLLWYPRGAVSNFQPYGRPGMKVPEALEEVKPDVMVDATPSNYETGEPGVTNAFAALERGVNLVLANKSALALRFQEVMEAARGSGVKVMYKATVMAGTPFIDVLRWSLYGQEPLIVEGVFNGTTNYILNLVFDEGLSVEEALKRAQEEGYAEPDPSLDVDGWDPAAKAAIVASTLGCYMTVHDVDRRSLLSLTDAEVEEAKKRCARIRYVAHVDVARGVARVEPRIVDPSDPLYNLPGPLNAAKLRLWFDSTICITGPGAGRRVTAAALLSDVVAAVART